MNKRHKFALVQFPFLAISIFFVFNLFAICYFPGSEKSIINFQSDSYSFTHNFFSELGAFTTSPDEIEGAVKIDNTLSMLLFNGSLIIVGCSIMLFYNKLKYFFQQKKDSAKTIYYSNIARPLGMVTGLLFAGVGLIPHDLHFLAHVFCAHGAFLTLLILSIVHILAVFHSRYLSNNYALGYLLFIFILATYLGIIFLGPKIGPGVNFKESELILQVVAQKIIVLTFIASMLLQLYGINNVFKASDTIS